MSLNGMNRLRFANAVLGAVLLSSGTITTYLDTLGAARAVSAIFAAFGLGQLILSDVLETVDRRTTATREAAPITLPAGTPPTFNPGSIQYK